MKKTEARKMRAKGDCVAAVGCGRISMRAAHPRDDSGTRPDAELFKNMDEVGLLGCGSDSEALADFAIGPEVGDRNFFQELHDRRARLPR